jgi:hypothetical protein
MSLMATFAAPNQRRGSQILPILLSLAALAAISILQTPPPPDVHPAPVGVAHAAILRPTTPPLYTATPAPPWQAPGAHIVLNAPEAAGLRAVVQWQGGDGRWYDVDGWRSELADARARRHPAAAWALWAATRKLAPVTDAAEHEAHIASAGAGLSADDRSAAEHAGRAMSFDQTVAYALAECIH